MRPCMMPTFVHGVKVHLPLSLKLLQRFHTLLRNLQLCLGELKSACCCSVDNLR